MAEEKILVIDDEENVRNILKTMLETKGYVVDIAANGQDGLEKLEKEDFSLIISDVRMPKVDGFGLLQWVKENKPKIPVIFITGYGAKDAVIKAMKMGLGDYIEKPFNVEAVFKTIDEQIKKSQ